MKKILASALVALALVSTTANAKINKGQCNKASDITRTVFGCIFSFGLACPALIDDLTDRCDL